MKTSKYFLSARFDGLPPTVNHTYGTSYARRQRYKAKSVRDWERRVEIILMRGWRRELFREWPYAGPVGMEITFVRANHRRWDMDNRLKVLQDRLGMNGIKAIRDDCQVDKLVLQRRDARAGETESTEVKLWALKTPGRK